MKYIVYTFQFTPLVEARPRFEEYLSMLILDKPILAFQQPYLEKDWTKMEIFKQICPNGYLQLAMTLQLWGACFILMKSKITEKWLIDWNDIRLNHIDLFTDKNLLNRILKDFMKIAMTKVSSQCW